MGMNARLGRSAFDGRAVTGLLRNGLEAIRERRFPAALPLAGTIGLLLAALLMFPSFDSYSDLSELTLFGAFVGFIAAGETLVLLIGGVDLSSPWVMTAAGVLVATLGYRTARLDGRRHRGCATNLCRRRGFQRGDYCLVAVVPRDRHAGNQWLGRRRLAGVRKGNVASKRARCRSHIGSTQRCGA